MKCWALDREEGGRERGRVGGRVGGREGGRKGEVEKGRKKTRMISPICK